MYRRRSSLHQRQIARAALDRPRLTVDEAMRSPPALPRERLRSDAPAIEGRFSWWWRVRRVELHGDERREVLIAEFEDEEDALRFAIDQRSQCTVRRQGDKRRPFLSYREPLVVPTPGGPIDV
jgi:hypothetical protein